MIWIAPSEKDTDNAALEKRLWDAAEQAVPAPRFAETDFNGGRPQGLLGLIFLRFAEVRFAAQRAKLEKSATSSRRGSRLDEPAAYHAEGILYLPAEARFDYLLNRPEAENTGMAKCEVRVANSESVSSTFEIRHSTFPRSPLAGLRRLRAHLRTRRMPKCEVRVVKCSQFDSRNSTFAIRPVPQQHRPPPHRSHRTLPGAHPRPRVRFGRHVRLLRALRLRAQAPSCRWQWQPNHRL